MAKVIEESPKVPILFFQKQSKKQLPHARKITIDHRQRNKQSTTTMLPSKAVAKIFPYHIHLDEDLIIKSVGKDLPRILGMSKEDLIGHYADSLFAMVQPRSVHHWTRDLLFRNEDKDITIEPVLPSSAVSCRLILSGSVVITSRKYGECLLILTPDKTSLRQIGLPKPRYGLTGTSTNNATDALSQSNHDKTRKIESLTAKLKTEQALLESLLPAHVAEGFRTGKHVEPMLHDKVTMFFSDIAGFTSMCDKLYPWGTWLFS